MAAPEPKRHYNNHIRNVRVVRQGEESPPPNAVRRKHPVTRNVTTTTPKASQAGSAPSIDEQFSEQYASAGIRNQRKTNSRDVTRAVQATNYQSRRRGVPGRRTRTQSLTQRQRLKLKKKKPNAAKTALARTRATAVNLGIWSWGLFTWLIFQLPLAILNIVMLGAAVAVDELKKTLVTEDEEGSIYYYLGDLFVGAFEKLAGAVSYLVGFDITAINPTNLFFIS